MRNGLVEGVSLRAMLRESGAMAPEAAASVLAGTLLTLGVVHGDVRPENVLVDASGGLTVTGFDAPDPKFDPDEPTYLAPERIDGGPATPAADVFAATAVFFECLTNEPPFRAATPEDLHALHEYTQIIAEFAPDELRPLIQRGLAADPAARPESAHAFLADVEATATAAYGADWQARGRALLSTWATAAADTDGAELAGPDEMPEPPPVGEPIDERLLALGGGVEEVEGEAAEAGHDWFGPGAAADLLSRNEHASSSEVAEQNADGMAAEVELSEDSSVADAEPAEESEDSGLAGDAEVLADEPAALASASGFVGVEANALDLTEAEPVEEPEDSSAATAASDADAAGSQETGAFAESAESLATGASGAVASDSDVLAAETEPTGNGSALPKDLSQDDLLSAFDELAPRSKAEPAKEPEPAVEPVDATAEPSDTTAKLPPALPEPRLSPSVQADIDTDWVIPPKSSQPTARVSLSAYANSLPSLPRPVEKPAEPVQTSAPDDWFRPGVAEPVDRGPRPTRRIDPDRDSTLESGFDDEDPESDDDEPIDPGGPRRKTLVGAVTAAVLLVAGAAAVVLGGSHGGGPASTAQSSTGSPAPTPTGSDSSDTPTAGDGSSTAATYSGGVPTSRHSTSRSSSHSKPSGTPTHSPSTESTPSRSATSPSPTPTGGTGPTTTPSGTGSTGPTHTTSSPSSHPSSPTDSSTGGLLGQNP